MLVIASGPAGVHLKLDASLYGESVLYKCFYWYGRDFDVSVQRADQGLSFQVELSARTESLSEEATERLISRVKRDLIDFKTRDIVSRETQAIRELLVAKAFASGDDVDQPPIGSVADLEGVEPRELPNEGA